MAKQNSLFLPTGYNTGSVSFTSADTTTKKTVFTAGANDSDIKALAAATDDSAQINVQIWVNRSSTDYLIGTVNVPASSGANGTANAVDLINDTALSHLPIDSAGKRYIPLKNGDVLKVNCLATMTGAKTLYVSAFGQDY